MLDENIHVSRSQVVHTLHVGYKPEVWIFAISDIPGYFAYQVRTWYFLVVHTHNRRGAFHLNNLLLTTRGRGSTYPQRPIFGNSRPRTFSNERPRKKTCCGLTERRPRFEAYVEQSPAGWQSIRQTTARKPRRCPTLVLVSPDKKYQHYSDNQYYYSAHCHDG